MARIEVKIPLTERKADFFWVIYEIENVKEIEPT